MHSRNGCAALLCWLVAVGQGFAADDRSTPADVTVLHNLRYREGPSKSWVMDLAMKKDTAGKPRPDIVLIHGGGWLAGDKSSFTARKSGHPCNIEGLAALGFVAATINYRLSG